IDYLSGIQKDPGYSVLPVQITTEENKPNQIVAFVEFVYSGTPAEEKGLKRGDIIYRIDGKKLNTDNYSQLLSQDKFTITLGKINSNGEIEEEESNKISLEARELNLNPIVETSIIDTAGHKIGYLAYASFISDYDVALADTIEYFKNEGVTDFVLDLRYNDGGAIASARKLSEMLVPDDNEGDTFIKEEYNDLITEMLKERNDWTTDSFQINFRNPEDIEDVNTRLDIDQLHVLTTSTTASASEMIIYGLGPYMDVVQIGGKTHGKYYGSNTFSEEDKHSWAIQPIIVRLAGANDDLDYYEGLSPDHPLEDINSLAKSDQLGEAGELFLAKAISDITGEPFPYEEDDLKSLERLKSGIEQNTQELKKKLDPWYGKMWTTIPEMK
ncbi:MAG: S41 family peptidase, partial [Marinilabiliaceae bacterium]